MTDRLYYNGRVFTGCSDDADADAFRVSGDGTFFWAGHFEGDPPEGSVDLGGRFVLPGLIEAHEHALIVAGIASASPCTIPAVRNIDDMVELLRRNPNFGKGPDAWITGWGYDETKLAERRTPTRHDLDRVSTTQPVYVIRSDCHSGICNTRALELAGVTRDTPDPKVGAFGRDPDGTPNGVLFELEANARVRNLAEKPDFESVVRTIAASARHFHERGYAVTTEMMARLAPLNHLRAFREAEKLGFDLQAALYLVWEGKADPFGMRDLLPEEKTGRVRFAGLKLFADGSVSGRTAWVNRPYSDGTTGLSTLDLPTLAAAYEYARRNALQLSIHVMGDRSLDRIIDFFADKDPWLDGIPSVRLEHVTLISRAQLARMRRGRMSWGATTQVIFAFAEIESYREALVPEVFKEIYPVRMLESELGPLALSSDSPATTWMDPDDMAVSLEAAVTRRAYEGSSINAAQSIPVGKALRLYTGRASGIFRTEVPAGRIAAGCEADFNVMSADPFGMEPEDLRNLRVDEAYMRGEKVFARR
ncbi:MAG: amidohydrolase [Sutterellaceae bacterium]|nr:amidohydrolase [Sutterellaceae bacterium]MDD7442512.1 amidohydrolase [Sutterellaceae bacterium]MDY2869221.1 amidohydrolase [Mesosutterella sp.]